MLREPSAEGVGAFPKIPKRELDEKDLVPLYDISAIAGTSQENMPAEEHILRHIHRQLGRQDCDFGIHVHGDSMSPAIMDKDIVLLKEEADRNLIQYGVAHVIITSDHRYLKRLMESRESNCVLLRSDNQSYGDIELPKDKILRLFLVKGVIRINKTSF